MASEILFITTTDAAAGYRKRIRDALPADSRFEPLMTLYLTDNTSADDLARAKASGFVHAVKYYPAGATTNSESGVTSLPRVNHALAAMERLGIVLSIHGEVTDADVDVFDRERVFVERHLGSIVRDHPGLRIVLEHITTREAAQFVADAPSRVAATITPQHLLYSRNALFAGGLRPHLYCLPVAKRERHRLALRKAATSGETCFFIGTDTAPHRRAAKEADCCSAGVFGGATALQTYVQVFDEEGALDRFEAFASINGARFYGLQLNRGTVVLERRESRVMAAVAVDDADVVVFQGGQSLPWSVGKVSP